MAGILHFSNYFRYMEATEHAFFRSLGMRVHDESQGTAGAARVRATCDYRQPLRYEDVVELHLTVTEMGTRSMAYLIVFRKQGTEVARGEMTVVFIRKSEDGTLESAPIPDQVRAKVTART